MGKKNPNTKAEKVETKIGLEENSDFPETQTEISANEFTYELKIPQERVGVLIGTAGETKKQIEEQTGCKLEISPEGDVMILGDDGMKIYIAKDVVKAIARGFNPKIALQLLKPDFVFEMIDLTNYSGKNKNDQQRLKGRVIGKGGKSREEIERLTDTYISVYGKTISLIGEIGKTALARQAIGMLLDGAMHKTVYHHLEKKRKEEIFSGINPFVMKKE